MLVLLGAIPLYGQERANIQVFKELAAEGVEALFLTNAEHGERMINAELRRLDLPYVPAAYGPAPSRSLGIGGWFAMPFRILATNWAFLRAKRRFQPTHVHVMNILYVLYASPALMWTKVPLIYRICDAPPVGNPVYRWLWKQVGKRCNLVVCCTDYIRSRCVMAGLPESKIRRIYNSPGRPQPERAASVTARVRTLGGHDERVLASEEDKPTLLYCGQITKAKGVSLLIEACLSLLQGGREFRLLLAGDYSYQNPFATDLMERVQAERRGDAIDFLGYVTNASELFSLADIHVCPSIWDEPLGNTVLEAKRAGIPSIIFPRGGLRETVVSQESGLVCERESATALEEAISHYLDHPSAVREQGRAALASVAPDGKFGVDRFRRAWLEVFYDTLPAPR